MYTYGSHLWKRKSEKFSRQVASREPLPHLYGNDVRGTQRRQGPAIEEDEYYIIGSLNTTYTK